MFRAHIKLPAHFQEDQISQIGAALDDISDAHTAQRQNNDDDGNWIVEWFLAEEPEINDLSARLILQANMAKLELPELHWQIEPIAETNWLEESYQQFPPFSVGPFFIYGGHFEDEIPQDQMGLQIDAATAFGSGEHATTKGCLQAMIDLNDQGLCPWNVLDMGTGSGILALAAWKLWKTPILAVDCDEEAIRVTKRHLKANGVTLSPSSVSCKVNEGFAGNFVQSKGPYELIIANILAGPLKDMAPDLTASLDENSYALLSGILQEQKQGVVKVYESCGLALVESYDIDEWTTLVMRN